MDLTIDNKYKFSYGHLIPDELVNKILIMREPHPLAKLIHEIVIYIEWKTKVTGCKGRGENLFINNSQKMKSITYYQEYVKLLNKKYPNLKHRMVFPYWARISNKTSKRFNPDKKW